jgi:hypothetical protein
MGYGIYRARGDYGVRYRRGRGDPGFFGTLGSVLGTVGKVAAGIGLIPPPIAAAAGVVKNIVSPTRPPSVQLPTSLPMNAEVPITAIPGLGRKRRRMNPGNTKALNRAIRRVSSFGSLVQRSKKSVAKANRALNPGRSSRRAPKVC